MQTPCSPRGALAASRDTARCGWRSSRTGARGPRRLSGSSRPCRRTGRAPRGNPPTVQPAPRTAKASSSSAIVASTSVVTISPAGSSRVYDRLGSLREDAALRQRTTSYPSAEQRERGRRPCGLARTLTRRRSRHSRLRSVRVEPAVKRRRDPQRPTTRAAADITPLRHVGQPKSPWAHGHRSPLRACAEPV
jgi:hypothetical protein